MLYFPTSVQIGTLYALQDWAIAALLHPGYILFHQKQVNGKHSQVDAALGKQTVD